MTRPNISRPIKVAIFATHPIQYQVPWFQHLASANDIDLVVYYALLPTQEQQGVGFNVPFNWDIPMLEGYRWRALPNAARRPALRGFFSSSTPFVAETLAQNRPDVAIVTGWNSFPLLQATWACIRARVPMILRAESNALRRRSWWVRLAHRLLISQFSAFLAIGRANREFYTRYGVRAGSIFACNYFVDNKRIRAQYDAAEPYRPQLRNEWGIPEAAYCFIYVGKLEPKKRILDLLDALARIERRNVHLLVVGAGALQDAAKERAATKGLPVTFAGFLNQTQLGRCYAAADCLVLPSDYGETWGLVVNEAMVCGLPAIVSDRVGCGPDLVHQGQTGVVVPFGNIEALSEALTTMASDPNASRGMGVRARELVARYSVDAAVQSTREAVRYVLGK